MDFLAHDRYFRNGGCICCFHGFDVLQEITIAPGGQGPSTKSSCKVTIELKNLKLQSTRTKKTQVLQPLVYKFEGDFPIDRYCNSLYWNVNEHMALAFQQLEPQLLANTK